MTATAADDTTTPTPQRSAGTGTRATRIIGIATIVMNPVGGGRFAEGSSVFMRLAKKVGAKSVPDLAIRYVLSNPNVDTILCGMQKMSEARHA